LAVDSGSDDATSLSRSTNTGCPSSNGRVCSDAASRASALQPHAQTCASALRSLRAASSTQTRWWRVCGPIIALMALMAIIIIYVAVSHKSSNESSGDVCQTLPNATAANMTMACSEDCLVHCWHQPRSPCLQDCALCTAGRPLFVAAMLPFLGRFAIDSAITGMVKLFVCRHRAVQIGSVVAVSALLSAFWAALSRSDVYSTCAPFPGCRWRHCAAILYTNTKSAAQAPGRGRVGIDSALDAVVAGGLFLPAVPPR
jgi:hypothetical protein